MINFLSDMNDEVFDEYVRKLCIGLIYEILYFLVKIVIKEYL